MLKTLKNQKGFTLVEVIVVAVIVLILAAVAIPLYNGYIKDSRQNVANNTAGSVASAFAAAIQADLEIPDTKSASSTDEAEGTITIVGKNDDNIIRVPVGYTVKWDEEKVWAYYTKDNEPAESNRTNYTYNVEVETETETNPDD